jgi:hypothetical protein
MNRNDFPDHRLNELYGFMNNEQEIWKNVEGYDGKYQVSNLGRVRRWKHGKWYMLKCCTTKRCYKYAHLTDADGNNKKLQVHRLVALAFVEGYADGLVVNHKNENPSDNRAENLEWVTQTQNMNSGTVNQRKSANCTKHIVLRVSADGEIVGRYNGVPAASRATGFAVTDIRRWCRDSERLHYAHYWIFATKEESDKMPDVVRGLTDTDGFEPMEGERWADIEGYEGYYQVSDMGRVRNVRCPIYHGGVLTPSKAKHSDYLSVHLSMGGHRKTFYIHRLVAMTFVSGYQQGMEVNHRDENPANNRADNLEWTTVTANRRYGTRIERTADKRRVTVLQYSLDGEFIAEYHGLWNAARAIHRSSPGMIGDCCKGRCRQAYGFIWKYKDKKE